MTKAARTALICMLLTFLLVTSFGSQTSNAGKAEITVADAATYPPVSLRGYGILAGSFSNESAGSVLEITCEDQAKAKLLQAKYLSDLQLLPGVSQVKGKDFTSFDIQAQGSIAAFCQANKVTILAARSAENLAALVKQIKPAGATTAQVEVPMYLDRWDKFAFRHYYWPWQMPKGETVTTYDFIREFDWARQQQRSGIAMFYGALNTDGAEGMMNYGYIDWVLAEAKRRELPTAMNPSGNAGYEPAWILDRYRDQNQLRMPGFTGNYHSLMSPYAGGQGVLSWNSGSGQDAEMSVYQSSIRRFAADSNMVSFMEPHAEMKHGDQDILLEYGPVADANYRLFLQEKYTDPGKVAARWGMDVNTWNDVRVPELASFAGWGPQALDVGGKWRVGYETLLDSGAAPDPWDPGNQKIESIPAPEDWFDPGFDDSHWPEVEGAGHDQQLFLPKRPAVFRRSFEVPAAWKAHNRRVWMYVWDLNKAAGGELRVVLNGTEVGRSTVSGGALHWSGYEVTTALKAGTNKLAIRLPQGYIAYKSYLSPVEPRQYPALGEKLNAQWVDFIDFTQWSRVEAVRRGVEMIRQVDPNRYITLASPDAYADGLKALASTYGGEFHNTGYMAAFWADYLPALMRGADLPFSTEPGGPAKDLPEFKSYLGLWQTEGVQSIDYFIHLGNILWDPQIKAEYESQRRQLALMGQSHFLKAETAILYSDNITQLTGFPWGSSFNTNLGAGYWKWNAGSVLRGEFPYDGLSQSSFARGEAKPYRVIIDSNTSVMTETQVSEIEAWIRAGGTFITLAQTGRHTPEKPDAWPIARLTGFKVTRIDQLNADGGSVDSGILQAAGKQTIFGNEWNGAKANGLHLQRTAPDSQNLLMWNDGSVAAGMRPLGKGYIVQLGAKFTGNTIFQRVEPGGNTPVTRQLRSLLTALLKWRDIKPELARIGSENEWVMLRHGVTNNGLYDTWTLWNQSKDNPQTVSALLPDGPNGRPPAFVVDMRSGAQVTLTQSRIDNIVLQPGDTRVFITPRNQVTQAPLAWFDLQRKWWRGSTRLAGTGLANPSGAGSTMGAEMGLTRRQPRVLAPWRQRFASDLTANWKCRSMPPDASATAEISPAYNDTAWESQTLGVWNTRDQGHRKVFRKTFTVPAEWNNGRVSLWMMNWSGSSFVGRGRVLLDGREIKPDNDGGIVGFLDQSFKAGTKHVLVVDAASTGVLAGLRGQSWLAYEPAPLQNIDLGGQWESSQDALKFAAQATVPGAINAQMLRRKIVVDAKYQGRNAVITVEGDRVLIGVLINGRLARRHHHLAGNRWSLNVTPFVRWGRENEIYLVTYTNKLATEVREVQLGFYDPDFYP